MVWQYVQFLQNMVMFKNKAPNTVRYYRIRGTKIIFGVKNMLLIMCTIPLQHWYEVVQERSSQSYLV
jgi:hypothetical protein